MHNKTKDRPEVLSDLNWVHTVWKSNEHNDTSRLELKPGLQIRVRIGKLFSLFLIQNICFGYSEELSQ